MFATLLAVAVLAVPAPPGDARRPAPLDDDVVRQLVDALRDPDFEVRQNLAAALAKTGGRVVAPLRDALKDKLAERRSGAAYTLGLLGEVARPALPELLDALHDPDPDVRRQASFAIARVVPAGRAAADGTVHRVVPPAGVPR